MNPTAQPALDSRRRRAVVLGLFALAAGLLAWRAVELQVREQQFLQNHADARQLRTVTMPANRGMLTDRHGEPLAISTPVSSIWAHPGELLKQRAQLPRLAGLLELDVEALHRTLVGRAERSFVYLRRHVDPALAGEVMALGIPGVNLEREYRRYYPASEVTAHLLGFTNIDDVGQEGLELAYERELRGEPGSKRVLKDRLGAVIADVASLRTPRDGRDIALSIDRRLQYVAYRELKSAVQAHRARAGSIVVLDVRTGEVLALVNQPAYNPNNPAERTDYASGQLRNRAATDVFEPGSTLKPFTVAAALESGAFEPSTPIDTGQGSFRVGRHLVKDVNAYGRVKLSEVIVKSSNVGASKVALALEPAQFWDRLREFGFGSRTASGFPGEASGYLSHHLDWRELDRAILAYGYGLSTTALQLAQAYQALANGGVMQPLSLRRLEGPPGEGRRVVSAGTANQVLGMMEGVVEMGTGQLAQVAGYRVAGKTGTVHKSIAGGYAEDRYLALFAGVAPASAPRLMTLVMIDEPARGEYFGGRVAAPVFAQVMSSALRLLDIPPDDLRGLHEQPVIYASSSPVAEPSWNPR